MATYLIVVPEYGRCWCQVVIVQMVYLHAEIGHGTVIGIQAVWFATGLQVYGSTFAPDKGYDSYRYDIQSGKQGGK